MQDYIHGHMNLNIEQFRALVFKNFLLHSQGEGLTSDEDESTIVETESPEM